MATYWHIGERLVREEQVGLERAAYGEQVLARVGRTLGGEFGRGFAERSLRAMRQFYQAYPIRGSTPKPLEVLSSEFRACPHRVPGDKSPIAACTGNLYHVVGAWEPIATGFFALFR